MSLTQGQLAPATITSETGEIVQCLFRPKEYSFSKDNEWTPAKIVGADMKPPQFVGGHPMTVTLELWFDTYERHRDTQPQPEDAQDVRITTGKLWKMMRVTTARQDPTTHRSEPPHVTFRWGLSWSFPAVIKQITEKFVLFRPDGIPVRSVVTLQLLQAAEVEHWPSQNPTSGAKPGYNVHIVKEGETIDSIAFSKYGSSNAWRHLADANNLDDPSRLRPGQRLLVAPLHD